MTLTSAGGRVQMLMADRCTDFTAACSSAGFFDSAESWFGLQTAGSCIRACPHGCPQLLLRVAKRYFISGRSDNAHTDCTHPADDA